MEGTYPRNLGARKVVSMHIQFGSELPGKQGEKESIISYMADLSTH